MVIFANGDYTDKIEATFAVFDLDNSKEIDRKELSMFIRSTIFGLCKLCGIPKPTSYVI